MPASDLRFVKRLAEFCPKAAIKDVPGNTRGIYALLAQKPDGKYDVIYVGMAGADKAGARGRLRSHANSKKKGKLWTHFTLFEVWDNITQGEVSELEGILRHIYRKDSRANQINKQKRYSKFKKVRNNNLKEWKNP